MVYYEKRPGSVFMAAKFRPCTPAHTPERCGSYFFVAAFDLPDNRVMSASWDSFLTSRCRADRSTPQKLFCGCRHSIPFLELIWREFPNPRNLEFRPLRSSLQTDDRSRFQLHTQRAEPSSILSDVNGMCQMCDLVDEDLDRQDHFSAGVFSFVEHQDTVMVAPAGPR